MEQRPALNGQQILQMKASLAAEKFDKYIKKTPFPKQPSENWKELVQTAIHNTKPFHLRISLKEFYDVITADVDNLTIFQLGCLSNAIEVVSFVECDLRLDEYKEALKEALELIELYSLEITRIRAKVEKEVDGEVAMKMAAEQAAANGVLKPVKGEA